jgi:hypothetical protein
LVIKKAPLASWDGTWRANTPYRGTANPAVPGELCVVDPVQVAVRLIRHTENPPLLT